MIHPESFLFITLDSCRFDTFVAAGAPNLKSVGPLHQAMAPGNFTYPSHQAMFMGFTPGVPGAAVPYVNPKYAKIFRLQGAEKTGNSAEDFVVLTGSNIIEGLKRLGYFAVGSGAVGWFNPETPTGRILSKSFQQFFHPGNRRSIGRQLEWADGQLATAHGRPVFLFLNVGETHLPYHYEGAPWNGRPNPCVPFAEGNNADECRMRQLACLEYVDTQLAPLIDKFRQANIVVCADHGDAWGEDGMWSHAFHHPKVLEVPLLFQLNNSPTAGRKVDPPAPARRGLLKKRLRRTLGKVVARLRN